MNLMDQNDLEYQFNQLKKEVVKLKNKKILITGGLGFLGFNFLNFFHYLNFEKNYNLKVEVYDIVEKNKLPKWFGAYDNKISYKKCNIVNQKKFKNVDYIIHAASIASPTYYRKYPIETMDANVIGLRNLIEFYKNKPIKGMLFFSTSEVYGDPDKKNIPTKETYRGNVSCTGPRACYDESKRYGETICVNFYKKWKIPIKIVRPFNNYGPGLNIHDKRVIPDFSKNILTRQDIVLFSDGKPSRTFCYISDAIIGYIKTLIKGKPGEVYNIGNNNPEISIKELANLMIKVANKKYNYKGKLVIKKNKDKNYLVDNPNRRCPDLSKSRKELNFYPKINLLIGINKTLEWYNKNQ
jgi:UDP-glucuronate decarboxylase